MAKAKEIAGLDCAAAAIESAALVLRARFDEMLAYRPAALDFADIEGVHAMRVAMRRLRSALRDFSFLLNQSRLRALKKDLKQIADALGRVRDEDVGIAGLEKRQSEIKNKQILKGLEMFIEERRAAQKRAQIDLTEMLVEARVIELRTRFEAGLETAFKKNSRAENLSFEQAGREVINRNLRDFADLSEKIYAAFDGRALHRLRIAAKRLRYSLQLFAVCRSDEEFKQFAKEISEMQTFLGDLHDREAQIENLSRRLCETGAARKSEQAAAEWLLTHLFRERAAHYRDALRLWREWRESDFLERLQAAVIELSIFGKDL